MLSKSQFTDVDSEGVLLARVYALILSWSDPEPRREEQTERLPAGNGRLPKGKSD